MLLGGDLGLAVLCSGGAFIIIDRLEVGTSDDPRFILMRRCGHSEGLLHDTLLPTIIVNSLRGHIVVHLEDLSRVHDRFLFCHEEVRSDRTGLRFRFRL